MEGDLIPLPLASLVGRGFSTWPFYGGGVRVEAPLNRWLVLGGNVELYRHPIDLDAEFVEAVALPPANGQPRRRSLTSHYDLWVKLVPFVSEGRRVPVELYVGIPLGFSLSTGSYYLRLSRSVDPNAFLSRDGEYPFVRTKWYGVDTGVLLGTQLLFHRHFAMFFEAGWRTIHTYNRRTPFTSDTPWFAVHSASNVAALNVGTMLFF